MHRAIDTRTWAGICKLLSSVAVMSRAAILAAKQKQISYINKSV